MFCIKCGRELEDEANFCPACGTRRVEAKAENKIGKAGKKRRKSPGKALKIFVAVGIGVTVLALVVLLIAGFGSNKGSSLNIAVSSSANSTAKLEKSDSAGEAGSGLTTKDDLNNKYEVKSTPKPKTTEKPKSSKSGGSGLVTMDDLKEKYKAFDSASKPKANTEQISGATD